MRLRTASRVCDELRQTHVILKAMRPVFVFTVDHFRFSSPDYCSVYNAAMPTVN